MVHFLDLKSIDASATFFSATSTAVVFYIYGSLLGFTLSDVQLLPERGFSSAHRFYLLTYIFKQISIGIL